MHTKATENQTKYHYTPSRMAAINNTDNLKFGESVVKRAFILAGKKASCFSHFGKQLAEYEVRYTPTSWPGSSFLWCLFKNNKDVSSHKDLNVHSCFFQIAKTWKQTKCFSAGE